MAGKGIEEEEEGRWPGMAVCMYVCRFGWMDGSERGGTNEGMMQLMQTGRNNLDTDRCSRSRQTYRPEFQIKINIQRFKKKRKEKKERWRLGNNSKRKEDLRKGG